VHEEREQQLAGDLVRQQTGLGCFRSFEIPGSDGTLAVISRYAFPRNHSTRQTDRLIPAAIAQRNAARRRAAPLLQRRTGELARPKTQAIAVPMLPLTPDSSPSSPFS
jgi:hypothetical protein